MHRLDVDTMLEEIGHTRLMEWLAFTMLEDEELKKAQEQPTASTGPSQLGGGMTTIKKF